MHHKNQSLDKTRYDSVPEDLVPRLLLARTGSTHVGRGGLLVYERREGVCTLLLGWADHVLRASTLHTYIVHIRIGHGASRMAIKAVLGSASRILRHHCIEEDRNTTDMESDAS